MKIFLSYGHDHNAELVNRVKADLNALGHDCWLDSNEIKAGNDWRRSIADGIVSSEWVLSFLSRHACREWEDKGIRKKGVCLDELAIAIGVKGSIVKTILVENPNDPDSLTPPLTVSHIQYLDMHDWQSQMSKSKADFEAWYAPKWAEILRIVNSPENQKFAGEIEILRDKLQPLDNSARIGQLMANDFIGREWLLEDINNWLLEKPQQKTYCLTGEPGFGKSAIAAWLAYQNRPEIIAAHFCQYNQPNYSDPNQVIRSIAFQIASRMPDYRRFLIAKLKTLKSQTSNHEIQQQIQTLLQSAQGAQVDLAELQALMEKAKLNGSALTLKPAELFQALIADAAYLTIDGDRTRYIIIIDAVDEASNTLVEFLAQSQNMLPNWLALLVTSRPNEDGIRQHLQLLNPHYHDLADTRNQDDVSAWIVTWLTSIKIETQKQAEILQPLLKASEGNFHYLRIFRQIVEKDPKFLDTPNAYPNGLDSLYLSNFKRQFPNIDDYRLWQAPFLRLIAASRSPLPIALARNIMQMSKEQFSLKVVQPLGSLFIVKGTGDDRTIEPFHKSLRDWLTHDERAGAYYVDAEEAHLQLANVLWKDFTEMDVVEGYLLDELPCHLLEMSNINDKYLNQIITDGSEWQKHRDKMMKIVMVLESALKHMQIESWCNLILKLDENFLHSNHPIIASSLTLLADTFAKKGDYAGAEPLYRRALAIQEGFRGSDHPAVAKCLNNLGTLLLSKGDHANAESVFKRALSIRNKTLWDNNPARAESLNNLATNFYSKGEYDRAEQLYRQALAIQDNSLETENSITASVMNNLSLLLVAKGDFAAAEPLYRRALEILEKAFGSIHSETANILNNLALLLEKMGSLAEAEQIFRRVLAIREKTHGSESSHTATALNNLAGLFVSKEDYGAAEPLYRRALVIRDKYWPEHPETATSLNNLGNILAIKGDFTVAEQLCRNALVIQEKALGGNHPDIMVTVKNLASISYENNKLDDSVSFYRRTFAIQSNLLGEHHAETIETKRLIGICLRQLGRYDESLLLFEQVLQTRQSLLGKDHEDTLQVMVSVAKIYRMQEKYVLSRQVLEQALKLAHDNLGNDHEVTKAAIEEIDLLK